MRRLVLKMSLSADGFVGGPNGELDWIFESMDEGVTAWTVDKLWQAGIHIMGRRTFQDMAAYWPYSAEPFAAPMNKIPKAVFTRKGFVPGHGETSKEFDDATRARRSGGDNTECISGTGATGWANPLIISGELSEEIVRMKNLPGRDILAHGGAGFARELVKTGLIDEYQLIVHPIALGTGLSLFSALPKPLHMKLIDAKIFDSGAIAHVFRPLHS
jgi:dihydrofolate reductase